jgi:hypothetical protein
MRILIYRFFSGRGSLKDLGVDAFPSKRRVFWIGYESIGCSRSSHHLSVILADLGKKNFAFVSVNE